MNYAICGFCGCHEFAAFTDDDAVDLLYCPVKDIFVYSNDKACVSYFVDEEKYVLKPIYF